MAAADDKLKPQDSAEIEEPVTTPQAETPVDSAEPAKVEAEAPLDQPTTESETETPTTEAVTPFSQAETTDDAAHTYRPEAEPEPTFDPSKQPEGPAMVTAPFAPPFQDGGKSRKKLFIIIAAVVVALLLVSSAAAWWWYNSPDKVLADATRNLMSKTMTQASGSFSIASGSESLSDIDIKGDYTAKSSQDHAVEFASSLNIKSGQADAMELDASVITAPNGDMYVKVGKIRQLIERQLSSAGYPPAMKEMVMSHYRGVLNKVDNQWIKLSQEELNQFRSGASEEQAQVNCTQEALREFQQNKSQQDEIFAAFTDNRFLTVDKQLDAKSIDGRDSLGYALKVDQPKAEAFGKAIQDTAIIKKLEECGAEFTPADSDDDVEDASVNLEVWVDRWSHDFTQLTVKIFSGQGNMQFDLKPGFDNYQPVEIPQNATTIKEIQAELEGSFQGLMPPAVMTN